jgi:hypothetical protein
MSSKIVTFGGILGLAVGMSAIANADQQVSDKAHEKDVVVSIVGCVQLEADYRRDIDSGKGGALGSGTGVANEFVLTEAKSVPVKGVHTDATYTPIAPTDLETAYSVTGNLEDALKREVGRQVEVTGYVEFDESAGTLKVKDLPRLHITRWSRVQDFCPAPKKK